jgi:2-C-methyl-D-erythritol 2,4-cyclodiphosphate synthase
MQRVGFGFDSHRFAADDRPLVLGSLHLEGEMGLAAHSDGDVVLHALTDAILGALAAGDIGEHFPDSDPQWENADSAIFLKHAVALAADTGLAVGNCDVTVIAEKPNLSVHKKPMAGAIAALLAVSPEQVSVKAKTAEGMGLIGRGEGIACFAIVSLKPLT